MGELIDRLRRLSIQAWSPDGGVRGSVRDRLRVEISFAPDAYRRYSEPALGHQLAQLAAVLRARYRREYAATVAAYHGTDLVTDDEPRDVEFRERTAALVARGDSARGWVSARSRALVGWEVTVADGAVRTLSQAEFLAEVDGAAAAILRDWQNKVILLTDDLYDIGVPASLKAGHDRSVRPRSALL
jgi:hypothetical protein